MRLQATGKRKAVISQTSEAKGKRYDGRGNSQDVIVLKHLARGKRQGARVKSESGNKQ